MPSQNILKTYVEGGYYHVYNRGVEKRIIFQDDQDYKVFLNYLKEYLSPPIPPSKHIQIIKPHANVQGVSFTRITRRPNNYYDKIELLVYCLMPNHFHLLIKQAEKDSLEKFMRSLLTRYSMYFNKRNDRVGSLFQDTYKAVLILEESYLLHLSRYIHLNPIKNNSDLSNTYSSYPLSRLFRYKKHSMG